jgi:hypothetical protein
MSGISSSVSYIFSVVVIVIIIIINITVTDIKTANTYTKQCFHWKSSRNEPIRHRKLSRIRYYQFES